ncbi:hypothetical protein T03_15069 [Trichinella britovi]|uniref:Uncharacterized protein n=1 Tax=Trichinella britovi TaxID=45882 RepID=A0A0V1CSA3_TRIBR|nr:hypothetical protein T03_15069 [Trichinella britovi]
MGSGSLPFVHSSVVNLSKLTLNFLTALYYRKILPLVDAVCEPVCEQSLEFSDAAPEIRKLESNQYSSRTFFSNSALFIFWEPAASVISDWNLVLNDPQVIILRWLVLSSPPNRSFLMADATSDKPQMDNVQATVFSLTLPSSWYPDGDFKRWLLHFESNYKLLVGTLKSKRNPKTFQVAAFHEFQRVTLMAGESMRSFAQRLQLLLDRACVTEDKMTNTTLLLRRFISGFPKNYSRQLMTGAEIKSIDEAVDRAQLLASVDSQLDTQTMATTHEMSPIMEEMKRKIDNSADRLDQTVIHNQAHGAANRSPGTKLPFRKAFKQDGSKHSGPPSWATELKGPSFRYLQQQSSIPPHWFGSTISLICKNLQNCDKNISGCDVVMLTASVKK